MLKLKRNLLSAALASATLLIATGAQAQSTANTDEAAEEAKSKQSDDAVKLDGVTVRGFRRGIEKTVAWFSNNENLARYRVGSYTI